VDRDILDDRHGRKIRKAVKHYRFFRKFRISENVSYITLDSCIQLTSPGGSGSSRGILGTEGRNGVMCDPATVGTASVDVSLETMEPMKNVVGHRS
jgi:hypothetical protein